MSINLVQTFNGSTITEFTSPTYTFSSDIAPDNRSEQAYCSSVGGTQTGVVAHTASKPFTATVKRPAKIRLLSDASFNATSGRYANVPKNNYDVILRKGVDVASGQTEVMPIRLSLAVPAGADAYDLANIHAGISAMIGILSTISDEIANAAETGTI